MKLCRLPDVYRHRLLAAKLVEGRIEHPAIGEFNPEVIDWTSAGLSDSGPQV
jgi:hypothetical protein